MKPTTQPQSHLVFANAQPRYVSMCFAPPSRQASRPDQPTQIGRIRYRLADTICWRGSPSLLQTSPVAPQSDQNP